MEDYYPRHCLTWPRCGQSNRECTCQCGDCGAAAVFSEAFLFETTNHSTYAPGTLVEAVMIGRSRADDYPGERTYGSWIFGRGVFDVEAPTDDSDLCPWWYFRADDLKPLTPAARRMYADLKRRNRHLKPEKLR